MATAIFLGSASLALADHSVRTAARASGQGTAQPTRANTTRAPSSGSGTAASASPAAHQGAAPSKPAGGKGDTAKPLSAKEAKLEAKYRKMLKENKVGGEVEGRTKDAFFNSIKPVNDKRNIEDLVNLSWNKLPSQTKNMINYLAKKAGSPQKVKWDKLSAERKRELLNQAVFGNYGQESAFDLMVFKNKVPKSKDVSFALGTGKNKQVFGHGTDKVDVSKLLQPVFDIHHGSTAANFIEAKFLAKGKAGNVAVDVLKTARLVGLQSKGGHLHISAPIPKGVQERKPLEVFALVDYYRRVNTYAELRAALDGNVLRGKDWFSLVSPYNLENISSRLLNGQRTDVHMAGVGWRSGSMYPGKTDQDTLGFEIRTLKRASAATPTNRQAYAEQRTEFLNTVQRGLYIQKYGISKKQLAKWYTKNVGPVSDDPGSAAAQNQSGVLSTLHYNNNDDGLIARAPSALKPLLTGAAETNLRNHSNENNALRMLVHDWSKDPVLADNPQLQKRVLSAQKAGLKKLGAMTLTDEKPTLALTQQFIKDSGLFEAFAGSLGMKNTRAAFH